MSERCRNLTLLALTLVAASSCRIGYDELTTGSIEAGGSNLGGAAGNTSTQSSAGNGFGGTAVGGAATGGAQSTAPTGGSANTGGNPSGGASSGPMSTGGAASGGAATGGNAATGGGVATGGAATGGAATGGAATGGAATGGAATGGAATGGAATGGASNSGGASGSGGCAPTHGGIEVCDGLDNDCMNGADDGVTCPSGCRGIPYAGNGYQFCEAEIAWATAKANCEAQGLHLVKIDTAAENTFVGTTAFATNVAFVWLGGDDIAVANQWVWLDGTLFWTGGSSGSAPPGVYVNWYPGLPGPGGNTPCLEMRDDYTWDDKQCSQGKRYVCETSY